MLTKSFCGESLSVNRTIMKKEIKNIVSLKSQLCDTSYCSVRKKITLSSMPLGWGFYFPP